jgi:hypothetical protein
MSCYLVRSANNSGRRTAAGGRAGTLPGTIDTYRPNSPSRRRLSSEVLALTPKRWLGMMIRLGGGAVLILAAAAGCEPAARLALSIT